MAKQRPLLRFQLPQWATYGLAALGLALGIFVLVRLSQNDPAATNAIVAIAALASSIAAVLALLQSAASTERQSTLLERADAVEVRRAVPLLGIALPELRADTTVTLRILNQTPSVAINVTLSVESRNVAGTVTHSSQRSWSAIPAGESKKWTPDGLGHPFEELLMRISSEGILGGSIQQIWVATGEGVFERRHVDILPKLPPLG